MGRDPNTQQSFSAHVHSDITLFSCVDLFTYNVEQEESSRLPSACYLFAKCKPPMLTDRRAFMLSRPTSARAQRQRSEDSQLFQPHLSFLSPTRVFPQKAPCWVCTEPARRKRHPSGLLSSHQVQVCHPLSLASLPSTQGCC